MKKKPAKSPPPETVMRAHQFLYYVMGQPVLSDFAYDQFCKKHGLEGNGGSDMESSYKEEEKELARKMLREHRA